MNTESNGDPGPMPLAELHCHLEGTVTPQLALRLGARHGMDLSDLVNADGTYVWRTFSDFLRVYDTMSEAIRTPEDYYDITHAYYVDAARLGLRYAEVFVSPAHARRYGMSYPTLIAALAAALEDAEQETGVVVRLILTCVRHFGVEDAEATAMLAERHPHSFVVGFGMAGDETYGHPRDFRRAFDIATGAGLAATAHAGELAGPESVRAVLDDLDVRRIGHGVRALEWPSLVEELVDRQIPMEICPSSNICTGIAASLADHPVRRFFDRGAAVTLSTDDPAFFDTDIAREYRRTAAAHRFTARDMLQITRNSIEAAFCGEKIKARLMGDIDAWERKLPGPR